MRFYARKAYDCDNKKMEHDVKLVEEEYRNSCVCQSTNIIATFPKNNSVDEIDIFLLNNNSVDELDSFLFNNHSVDEMNISQ